MEIHKLISPYNHYNGRNGFSIDFIVIHYVGALGGAEENARYYASQDVGASAHYFVGFSGEIWQSVEDQDAAWSVGGGLQGTQGHAYYGIANNYNTLNIELCVRKKNTATMNATDHDWYFENATVSSAIALTRTLMDRYSISQDHVIRHYDVVGKICPNPYVYNDTSHTWQEFLDGIASPVKPGTAESVLYRIQTGAFRYKTNAQQLISDLKSHGFDSFLSFDDGIYRVQSGAFSKKENALSQMEALKKAGFDSFLLTSS